MTLSREMARQIRNVIEVFGKVEVWDEERQAWRPVQMIHVKQTLPPSANDGSADGVSPQVATPQSP